MSKSPNSNIFILAIGGAALLLGVAFGVSTINYGNERIETLEASFDRERATATAEAERADQLASALSESETTAAAEIAALGATAAALQMQLDTARASGGVAVVASEPVVGTGVAYGLGREAHAEEILAWDVDVLPDGRGLPEGSGDVWTGEEVFADYCAACHGDFAEGRDAWPVLAGGFDTLDEEDPVKTVGSYWPYLSTVWDYVHRSMPFGAAGTLTDDEVYAIVAYILYSNDLVDDDFELSRDTFLDVEMYNAEGFIVDDRADTEYAIWTGEPCMENCKEGPVEITRRASDVGVTPADDGSMVESYMELQLGKLGGNEWGHERVAGSVFMDPDRMFEDENAPVAPTREGEEAAVVETAASSSDAATPDPQLVAAGEDLFRQCSSCHQIGDGAKHRSGPHLNGVVGRVAGSAEGFKYSNAFKSANEDGMVWDAETLAAFLADPKGYITGTRMSFRGLKSEDDLAAIAAYLATFSQ